jgi:hypothetical protein
VKDPGKVAEAMSRWKEAGVCYARVSRRSFQRIDPRVNIEDVAAIFGTGDVSLNSCIPYAKALTHARRSGAWLFTRVSAGAQNRPAMGA